MTRNLRRGFVVFGTMQPDGALSLDMAPIGVAIVKLEK